MKMSNKSPGGGSGTPQRCRLILQHCLAIQLSKPGHVPEDFWMYDSGYMIFQNFLAANAQCWWNAPLTAATRALKYAGHVAPGMLLVTAEPCALEVLRGAYARSVLKPPATYVINSVGDIDDCIVSPTVQGQFTPLPEALCDIIMDLTSQGHSATIENIRVKLSTRFPHMQTPTTEIIYDSLAQLMQEQKIYQTAKGYFIVTPERRRSRSRPRASYQHHQRSSAYEDHHHHGSSNHHYDIEDVDELQNGGEPSESRTMLMTNSEAVHSLYGEISTERDGDLTHQCIQTNLADMICGGNPNDKIIYARSSKRRSASFPTPRSLERRHSLRIFGSSKRLQRCSSTRSLSKNYAQALNTDSSSSEYQSTDSSSPKKASLLSRLFRRSGRSKQRQIETFSAQFPPPEWFNSKAVHLHSVGTQTADHELPETHTLSNSTFYDGSELSQRSMTLPRRHHRRHLSSESTFVISSRDCSPIRRGSPVYSSSSLPRSTHSIPTTSISTSATSAPSPAPSSTYSHPHHQQQQHLQQLHHQHHQQPAPGGYQSPIRTSSTSTTQRTIPSKHLLDEKNRLAAARSAEIYRSPIKKSTAFDNVTSKSGTYRSLNSGPSSYESGKASSLMTASGPSSIESGKVCYSRTSGHSSIESHTSAGGGQQQTGSPKSSSGNVKHYGKSRLSSETLNRVKSSTPNTSPSHHSVYGKPPKSGASTGPTSTTTTAMLPASNSNSSITLQVTTSNENHIPSTKIFVQNSPVRSVITLENGQLTENSNVVIINSETTTNANGELIKRTVSKQSSPPRVSTSSASRWETAAATTERHQQHQQAQREQTASYSETEAAYETGDSLSLISETSPDSSLVMAPSADNSKFTKNVNNDATMNNSRKLSLQIGQAGNSIVYKNCLKDAVGGQFEPASPNHYQPQQQQHNPYQSPTGSADAGTPKSSPATTKPHSADYSGDNSFHSSTSNLRYFEKNEKKLNSNCDLKALHQQFETPALLAKLNSNPAINNSDSLAHILHKNIITVGSEPNLAMSDALANHRKQNRTASSASAASAEAHHKKQLEKVPMMDRRFSVSTTTASAAGSQSGKDGTLTPSSTDIFTFPSLTDLSFNFTSLAAQKILQGVSLNSIDTLVELNMAQQEKQQNVSSSGSVTSATAATNGGAPVATVATTGAAVPQAICTDYGLV